MSRETARNCWKCCAKPTTNKLLDSRGTGHRRGRDPGRRPAGARHHGAALADGQHQGQPLAAGVSSRRSSSPPTRAPVIGDEPRRRCRHPPGQDLLPLILGSDKPFDVRCCATFIAGIQKRLNVLLREFRANHKLHGRGRSTNTAAWAGPDHRVMCWNRSSVTSRTSTMSGRTATSSPPSGDFLIKARLIELSEAFDTSSPTASSTPSAYSDECADTCLSMTKWPKSASTASRVLSADSRQLHPH